MDSPISGYARNQTRQQARLCWLFLLGQMAFAQAAENDGELQGPDIELLEFLGSFQTDNGEWIEPESLLTGEFAELLNMAASMDAATQNEDANDQDDNAQRDDQ